MTGLAHEPPSDKGPSEAAPDRRPSWSGLRTRVLSGLVLMAAALVATLAGGRYFTLFWLLAAAVVLWEWQALIGGRNRAGRVAAGVIGLIGAPLAVHGSVALGYPLLLIGAGGIAAVAEPGKRLISVLGLVYAGALVLSLEILRHSPGFGTQAVFWLFAVVWGTDIMAYFGGRQIGGPKLSPRVSPAKTWSGFLVGIMSGSFLGWAVSPHSACGFCMVLLGLTAGAVAQAGDLFESALKRRFGVKDASGLIPGHGGAMDRLDGFIAASVFVACLGSWRFGIESAATGLFYW